MGLLLATLGIVVVEFVRSWRGGGAPAPHAPASEVDLFRLPSGAVYELLLCDAGPDASGEPQLAAALFPDEDPPRRLATLFLANVDRGGAQGGTPWTVDLTTQPLRARDADGAWRSLDPLPATEIPAWLELRRRSLGGGRTAARVEPGSVQQMLLALPPGRRVGDLSDVQWGDVPLVRDRLELERLRRFRLDPAGTTTGR